MTTYRVVKTERFTQIDRRAVNDARLSFRARGVLTWIIDKPADWQFDSETLAQASPEGRDAIRTALRELEGQGYMRRTKIQNEHTGRWKTVTDVFEWPTDDGIPVVGNPDVGKPGATTETVTDTELSSKTSSSSPREQRKRDEVWDALVDVVGDVETKPEVGRRAKCVKELKAVGATASEIRARAREMQRRWPNVTITDTGLVGRWSTVQPRSTDEDQAKLIAEYNSIRYY